MEKMPESVMRIIPNAMEYIPDFMEDKGREVRPKREI